MINRRSASKIDIESLLITEGEVDPGRIVGMGDYVSAGGAFDRDSNYITTRITADADAEYPVEPGRYRLIVSRGDVVSRGQVIGYSGSTGDVSSPQLHFEIRHDTQPVNPKPLLMARNS